jgi:AcrR family transcriptional regulator
MPEVAPATPSRLDRRSRAARAAAVDSRAELLRTAAEVFAERGFRDASMDEIAQRAGYSKGALYWHFASKDELFLELVDERVHRPTREMVALLESAPPEQNVGPEASRRFVELLRSERELLLLLHEYWAQAVRDPELRARYAERQARLRSTLAKALAIRAARLGASTDGFPAEAMATAIMSLAAGLAQERLIAPDAVPDELLGDVIVLIYAGIMHRARARAEDRGPTAGGGE